MLPTPNYTKAKKTNFKPTQSALYTIKIMDASLPPNTPHQTKRHNNPHLSTPLFHYSSSPSMNAIHYSFLKNPHQAKPGYYQSSKLPSKQATKKEIIHQTSIPLATPTRNRFPPQSQIINGENCPLSCTPLKKGLQRSTSPTNTHP